MIVSNLLFAMVLLSIFTDAYITTSVSRSSFVGRQRHILAPSTVVQRTSTVTTTTTLHMNLFDRFSRVAKSNLNNILQSLEDPEKIMTQALEDMQVWSYIICRLSITTYFLLSPAHHFDIFRLFSIFSLAHRRT
jgi:hypothetical protein